MHINHSYIIIFRIFAVNFCISYIEKRIREGGDELGVLN